MTMMYRILFESFWLIFSSSGSLGEALYTPQAVFVLLLQLLNDPGRRFNAGHGRYGLSGVQCHRFNRAPRYPLSERELPKRGIDNFDPLICISATVECCNEFAAATHVRKTR